MMLSLHSILIAFELDTYSENALDSIYIMDCIHNGWNEEEDMNTYDDDDDDMLWPQLNAERAPGILCFVFR